MGSSVRRYCKWVTYYTYLVSEKVVLAKKCSLSLYRAQQQPQHPAASFIPSLPTSSGISWFLQMS